MHTVEPLTIGVLGAFGFEKEHYGPLESEIEALGHNFFVTEAPKAPRATFYDHAEAFAQHAKHYGNVNPVGHSRGINAALRIPGLLENNLVIGLCPSFDPSTTAAIGRPKPEEIERMPRKNFPGYEKHIFRQPDGTAIFDPAIAGRRYFNRCTKTLREQAVSLLTAQSRPEYEPPLLEWPDVDLKIIFGLHDKTIDPNYVRYISKVWFDVRPIPIHSDHAPSLSRPHKLAQLLVAIAQGTRG